MEDATRHQPNPLRLLFVCVENSCRSQMAEAFARIHGGERVDAHSAGSDPSGRVNPTAIAVMSELGYDLSRHRSKSPADLPPRRFDVLVSMGCGDRCPSVPADRAEEWEIPDPKALPLEAFRGVRDTIEAEVRRLLGRELAAREPAAVETGAAPETGVAPEPRAARRGDR